MYVFYADSEDFGDVHVSQAVVGQHYLCQSASHVSQVYLFGRGGICLFHLCEFLFIFIIYNTIITHYCH